MLAPGGNFAMESFRVWESLVAGAVPIIERGNGHDWSQLPAGHPLIFIDDWDQIHDVLKQLDTKTKMDAKQQAIISWWRGYVRQLQQMVADAVN